MNRRQPMYPFTTHMLGNTNHHCQRATSRRFMNSCMFDPETNWSFEISNQRSSNRIHSCCCLWSLMLGSAVNSYSIVAGLSACLASISGKLLFSQATLFSLVSVLYIVLFAFSNVFMWRCYSKALSLSSTSIQPTVVTKTSNFLLSALAGFFLFAEPINSTWLLGFLLIVVGVYLISTQHDGSTVQVSSHLD